MKGLLKSILMPVIAALVSIVIGGIIVAIVGYNPLDVYSSLVQGAFGGSFAIGNTLADATPLIFTGLGIALAFRAGLFNIGAEGQYWIGVIAAVWVGTHFGTLPGWLHIILCLVAAMLASGIWGGLIPGIAKAYRGAHEVITTMMMSYIAILLAKYLVENGPMMEPGSTPQSREVVGSVQLRNLIPQTQLTTGIIIAIVVAVIVWFVLFKTTLGFQLRSVGLNHRASRYAGIRVHWYTILALGLSGLLAGLGGAVQVLGVDYRLYDSFSSSYGYTGIVVALLGKSNPFGVIIAAIFFAALDTGGQNMQLVSGVDANLTNILQGLIVFFVAAERLLPMLRGWFRKRRPGTPTARTTSEEGGKLA